MTALFVAALLLAVAGWAAHLWLRVQRSEYLVVLRLDGGTFLLARQPDRRYRVVSLVQVVPVLARFEARVTAERYRALRAAVARPFRWTRAAAHLH